MVKTLPLKKLNLRKLQFTPPRALLPPFHLPTSGGRIELSERANVTTGAGQLKLKCDFVQNRKPGFQCTLPYTVARLPVG